MTANPFEGMSQEQIRGILAQVSAYTGKPIADVTPADLRRFATRTRAQLDQDAARIAHLDEINAIMERHRDLVVACPSMGELLDAMPPDDAARLCRLQELTGLLDGGAR